MARPREKGTDAQGTAMADSEYHCRILWPRGQRQTQQSKLKNGSGICVGPDGKGEYQMKTLVTYFSAGGITAKVAKDYAAQTGADLCEIVPEQPYTAADLNWKNPLARCNREFFGKKKVAVAGEIANFENYDQVLIGFPIWYGCAPNVVNTFCAKYDWTGKKIIAFATSGGSPIGKTAEKLRPYVQGAASMEAVLVKNAEELKNL